MRSSRSGTAPGSWRRALGLAVEELHRQRAGALAGGEPELVGLFSIRVPTVKSGSMASRTVAVLGPTVVTRPTSPSR
ncbi:hypothetical protein SCALM49S_06475 [Streptomyces californicus]